MDKLKKRRERKTEISQLSRTCLEDAYMNLFEISLQKTQLVQHLERIKKTDLLITQKGERVCA